MTGGEISLAEFVEERLGETFDDVAERISEMGLSEEEIDAARLALFRAEYSLQEYWWEFVAMNYGGSLPKWLIP